MRLAQAGAAVEKKRVVSGAGRLAYCHTTGVRKAIARPDDKILKCVVGMQLELVLAVPAVIGSFTRMPVLKPTVTRCPVIC